jgi:hypothetical protein
MRKSLTAVVLIAALAASGCAHRRGSTPDEFAVARNAPLVIPPDYTLTPPKPGTVTSTPEDSQQQAIEALFGGPAPRPLSESSLLDEAGRDRAALGVRSIAGDPKTEVVDMGETTRTIIAAPQADSDIASAQVP